MSVKTNLKVTQTNNQLFLITLSINPVFCIFIIMKMYLAKKSNKYVRTINLI